jgi:cysteinyl-tRNA synthetase
MTLRVYSTLTKAKEPFQTVRPGQVGMYLCGPTVYKSPHIGHMVGPVIFDAVKRYLTYKGFKVTWVINITDVEDKLIDASIRLGVPVADLAKKYTAEYLEVLRDLGVDQVDHFPRATDHIQGIVDLCRTLIDKSFAYVAEGSVYFDVSKDADYGRLSRRKVDEQEANAGGTRDLDARGKRNPADFALWKAAKPGEPGWPSPWGTGRPGWHIECSAMAMKLLGESFDIHGGGMDLLFPHHENEIAQSESATGKPLARYWMHNGLTRIKTKLSSGEWADEKMSGSIGNVVSARELLAQHGPEVLRYFLLSTHYRSPIEFTDKSLADAAKGYLSLARALERADRVNGGKRIEPDAAALKPDVALHARLKVLTDEFLAAMDDDFNTAGAIAALHQMASELNKSPENADLIPAAAHVRFLARTTLGLFQFDPPRAADDELAGKLMSLIIQLRADARKSKNFAVADQIRKGLDDAGVVLEDRADATLWRRKGS